jgi:hypothetical protein
MDWTLFWAATGVIVGNFIAIWTLLDKKFDKLDAKMDRNFKEVNEKISALDTRLSQLEGKVNHMDGMLGLLVSFLLGTKTGTDK